LINQGIAYVYADKWLSCINYGLNIYAKLAYLFRTKTSVALQAGYDIFEKEKIARYAKFAYNTNLVDSLCIIIDFTPLRFVQNDKISLLSF
jgi:hypothetical protein